MINILWKIDYLKKIKSFEIITQQKWHLKSDSQTTPVRRNNPPCISSNNHDHIKTKQDSILDTSLLIANLYVSNPRGNFNWKRLKSGFRHRRAAGFTALALLFPLTLWSF